MVKNIWMSHIGRCTELGYLSVGHISSNYHQHSKCTVLFVKHHYFHLSSFKKLLSGCWLIHVYIQCKTISSYRHFRNQQNRNWNFVHHCIKTWQKMQKFFYYMQLSLILQCFQDIFIIIISISNNAIKWSRMSEKWAKKAHVSSPPKCSTQLFKNTQKLLYTPQWPSCR